MKLSQINSEFCLACRGTKLLCGERYCPILEDQYERLGTKSIKLTSDLHGSSPPSFFVGKKNYPYVLAGPMIPPITGQEAFILDEPDLWFGKPLQEIILYRKQLVRTTFPINVKKNFSSKLLDISREITMVSKPVSIEAKLSRTPTISLTFDNQTQPLGPTIDVKSIRITENPKISRVVDKVVRDTDYLATEAIIDLYEHGQSVTKIERLLSAGLLGIKKKRKLVPTRWSITATDDILSKKRIEKIRDAPVINDYLIFKSKYLDNFFSVLLVPNVWSFEQLEAWLPGSPWINPQSDARISTDHEFFSGRKNYAKNVQGGYYAGRIAVTEYLEKQNRQATAIIFREIHEGYNIPIGVWQVRENVRNAMKTEPIKKDTLEEAINEAISFLRIPRESWVRKSNICQFLIKQSTLLEF
ncbi:MAG: Nre family DNA repair protein [Candidatus Ranarchaeia archaeon]